ncbi:hypothetical protein BKA59DRAFT_461487 [Fusarium tricinctum]|uniref:Uncharacterized protein n=1 Tax=Fusarium tricinctum TaxID=61284 RepID=A0A8K0W613_9HYPO|nr:hypothetical protein BKA59DRAFT_461487 [Fusarium tricinctum]
MSTKQPRSCHLPTPEHPSPCHPAPWRQIEAILFERIHNVALPDVVETAGSHLIPAPPTPVPASSPSNDDVFTKRLHRALELALFGQEVRYRLYGREIAENTRPGHSPQGLRERLLREAWEDIDSSSDSSSATPMGAITPPSCDEDNSRLETLVKNDTAEKKIPASSRKRKREIGEGEGRRVKRRRTNGDY